MSDKIVRCRQCKLRATFTEDALCMDCRDKMKKKEKRPIAPPEDR